MDLAQLRSTEQAVLVELRLHEAERQPRRPNLRHGNLAQEVWKRSHVVLVSVCEDDGANIGGAFPQVREVG